MTSTRAAEGDAAGGRRRGRSTWVDIGVLVGAWLFVALRILRSEVSLDDVAYSTPYQRLTLQAWSEGHLALWNTTSFGGTPHLGNLQTAALYPLHLVAAPFPDLLGGDVMLAVHMLILGVGCYMLGRRLGWPRPAPLLVAVAAMWSGSMIVRSVLLVHLPPLVWAPWAMLLVDMVVRSDRPRRATALLGVVAWCVLVSGHPQSVLMVGTLVGAWTVALVVEHRAWRRLGHVAASTVLAATLAAPALFALRSSLGAAAEASRDEAALRNPALFVRVRALPRLVLGEPFATAAHLLGDGERITYAGSAVVVLALVGLVAALRDRRWSLVGLAAVGLFAASMSFGLRSPTLRFARAVLPGFDLPRVMARWNWVLVMAMLVLAGAGIDRLRRGVARGEAAVVAAFAAAFVASLPFGVEHSSAWNDVAWAAVVAATIVVAAVSRPRVRRPAAVVLASMALLELAVPVGLQTVWRGDVVTSTDELTGPAERWLADQSGLALSITNENYDPEYVVQGMRPNANAIVGVRTIDGYDGGVAVSRRWHAALRQIIPSVNDLTFRAQLPFVLDAAPFARLGVHHVLFDPTRGDGASTFPGWTPIELDGPFDVYANPMWRGDVTVWYRTELVDSPEDAGDRLRLDGATYRDVGLVEEERAIVGCDGVCAPDAFISESDESGVRVADIVAAAPAVVSVAEQFDDGWTATVDGRPTHVTPVDGAWVGVVVGPGRHHIEFRYRPAWLWPSLVIMLLGLVAVVVLLVPTPRWSTARRVRLDLEVPSA